MTAPLRIAVAGLGTIGGGTVRLLNEHADLLAERSGRGLALAAVAEVDRSRAAEVDVGGARWLDDGRALADDPEVDVVVELIGGEGGVALEIVRRSLARGKHVVTANKAMIARHGAELAATAEEAGVTLAFEAAVGGGIPVLKALREGLAGNRVERVFGILNGTCNYILTAMRERGRAVVDVLAEAQALGYAEADPGVDVDGIDAAHKTAILAAMAFGCRPDLDAVHVEGIRRIAPVDFAVADELGHRIKLLGLAERDGEGVRQRVHPCLVPRGSAAAAVDGVFNVVVVDGDFVGRTVYQGRGAGAEPTASAVVADLIDLAAGRRAPPFAMPARSLASSRPAAFESRRGRFYLRFPVEGRLAALADVAARLSGAAVPVDSVVFREDTAPPDAHLILITGETSEATVARGLAAVSDVGALRGEPVVLRIESL